MACRGIMQCTVYASEYYVRVCVCIYQEAISRSMQHHKLEQCTPTLHDMFYKLAYRCIWGLHALCVVGMYTWIEDTVAGIVDYTWALSELEHSRLINLMQYWNVSNLQNKTTHCSCYWATACHNTILVK